MLLSSLIILYLTGCGDDEKTNDQIEQPEIPKYTVEIELECIENLIFSKYDINVYVDDLEIGTLDHGVTDTFSVELEEGEYALIVTKEDDSEVDGTVHFEVSKDIQLRYKLSCMNNQVEIEQIKNVNPPITMPELKNENYKDIVKMFENASFNNIETKKIKDLTVDQIERKSTIEEILINGKSDFLKSDTFFEDTEVLITYHTLMDINPPASSDELEAMALKEVLEQVKKAGFTDVETEKHTAYSNQENEVSFVSIDGNKSFDKTDAYPADSKVIVGYYVKDNSDSHSYGSDDNSDYVIIADAKRVFENYGLAMFPYGFECHWVLDRRASEVYDDGSCFLKVGVTIKNQYGTELEAVAEGTVKGSTVTGFNVNY